jgi:hypothetical protein
MTAVKQTATAPVMVEQKNTSKLEVVKESKPTANDRIKRAEQFELMAQKFAILTEKKNSLEKFLISDDGTQGCTLSLKSGSKTFEINNNSVIKELLTSAKIKLDTLIEIAEAEILNFVI